MRERIAGAIADHFGEIEVTGDVRPAADAVLAALAQPTEAMVDAGVIASEHQSVSRIYRAMIGAAS